MADQLNFLYTRQTDQFFRERKALGFVRLADRLGADIQCSIRRKPADPRIAPIYFTSDLNVPDHHLSSDRRRLAYFACYIACPTISKVNAFRRARGSSHATARLLLR